MTDREQLVRAAEELAEWHDEMAYHDFMAGGIAAGEHHKRAILIRRLLSLLPKEGEVKEEKHYRHIGTVTWEGDKPKIVSEDFSATWSSPGTPTTVPEVRKKVDLFKESNDPKALSIGGDYQVKLTLILGGKGIDDISTTTQAILNKVKTLSEFDKIEYMSEVVVGMPAHGYYEFRDVRKDAKAIKP